MRRHYFETFHVLVFRCHKNYFKQCLKKWRLSY